MIATSLSTVLLAGFIGTLPADSPGVELRYHGSLAKASRDGESRGEPLKRFDLYCLVTPRAEGGRDIAFVLDEQGPGGWPWPARFGTVATDAKYHPAKIRMRLLHEHEGNPYVLFVPFPYFEFADRLAADARWEAPRESEFANQRDRAPWKYKVSASAKVGGRDCWRVDATNNFGPQESVWIAKGSSLLVKAERRVVIGRGDVHVMRMELDSVTPLAEENLKRLRTPLAGLLQLQQELKRSDDDQSPELSEAQLKSTSAVLKSLEREGEKTPFERLIAAIVRDTNAQSRRTGDVESLITRFVGKPAPAFSLKGLDGEPVPASDYAGKIVLLHFWPYEGEPFPPEPYGQVGFLDFLHHRRSKMGVQVYGVAVDRRVADKGQLAAVVRSVKKLQGFMNLGYPLTLDDGSLLEKFGDPERVGARLPLWVLIDSKGTVIDYKVGNYEIKPNEGLTQLDKAIIRQIRKDRKARDGK